MAVLAITALQCKDKYVAVALIVVCSMFGDLGFTGSYLLSYLDLAPQYAGLLTGMSNMIGSIPGIISPTITGYITKNVSFIFIILKLLSLSETSVFFLKSIKKKSYNLLYMIKIQIHNLVFQRVTFQIEFKLVLCVFGPKFALRWWNLIHIN